MALDQAPSFSSGFQPLPLYPCLPLSFLRHPACCPRAALRPHFPPLFALSSRGNSTKPPPGFLSPWSLAQEAHPHSLPSLVMKISPMVFPANPAHLSFWDAFSCCLANTPFYFGKKKKIEEQRSCKNRSNSIVHLKLPV